MPQKHAEKNGKHPDPMKAPIIPQPPSFADQMAEQLKGFVSKGQAAQKAVDAATVAAAPFPVSKGSELLDLDLLEEHPNNPRQVFAKLEQLAEQIVATGGLLIPIIARPHPSKPSRYQIVAGARRYRALQLLKKRSPIADRVLVDIRQLSDAQVAEAFLTENDRENLQPLEEAIGYDGMLKSGHSVETIASTLSVSTGTVHGRLKLLELGPKAKKLLLAGVLTTAIATPLGRYPKAMQDEALERMLDYRNREGLGQANLWRIGEWDTRWSSQTFPDEKKKLNVGMAIAWLQEHFTKSLKTTAFNQEDETIAVSEELWPLATEVEKGTVLAPSCKVCPKNSNNMPAEVAGENVHSKGSSGFCTLPACYDEKWAHALKKLRSDAKEKGDVKVLNEAQSRAALKKNPYGYESKYAKLSEVNHRDPKKRTYGQCLDVVNKDLEEGEQIRKVLAVSDAGRAQLVNREEVESALAAKGEMPKPKKEAAGYDYQAAHRREDAKRQLRNAVARETLWEYAKHLVEKGPKLDDLRAAVLAASSLDADGEAAEAKAFGMKNGRELDAFIEKKATAIELTAMLLVRVLERETSPWNGYSEETERQAKVLKVDLKKREKATVVTDEEGA